MGYISVENAMELFFLIAPCLYMVNIIISGLFAYKYEDDIYKKNTFMWFYYLIFGISQGVISKAHDFNPIIKILIWTFCVFLILETTAVVVADMFKVKNNLKSDCVYYVVGCALTTVLFKTIDQYNLTILPIVFFAAWPVVRMAPLLIKHKENGFTKKGYLICALATALHVMDYSYFADKPEFIFMGYLIALILATGMSCFSFAVLVEKAVLEIEIKELLQTTARLTALGGMAAEISHEIKNPLTVLSLNNAQMKQKILNSTLTQPETDYYKNKLEIAEKMLKRLIDIMNTLRSHYNSGVFDEFKEVKVKDIFDEVNLLCNFRAQKIGVKVEFTEVDESVTVECRSVQIIQSLQNLVQNAMDELEDLPEPLIKVDVVLTDSDHIHISVTDNGLGIPDGIKATIFDAFFTTKPKEKGSGLGLSISKRFVEEHGGQLYLESSQPTKFVIALPIRQSQKISKHSRVVRTS